MIIAPAVMFTTVAAIEFTCSDARKTTVSATCESVGNRFSIVL
ncbi:hypothetical protein J591_1164 [Acinetobacter baumannii 532279]|nr:hypothetical protein J591_1164 [Acinetobacter baumannii 532279]